MVINRVSNNVIGDVIYDIINVISVRCSWGSLWFFLFLVHIRFLSNLSTIEVIRNCYRNGIVKLVRKFEKLCLHKGKHHFTEKQYWFGIRNQKLSKRKGVRIREREMKKGTSPKLWNTGLVFNRVSLTSWEEGASLALVGHPCTSDVVKMRIIYWVDVYINQPSTQLDWHREINAGGSCDYQHILILFQFSQAIEVFFGCTMLLGVDILEVPGCHLFSKWVLSEGHKIYLKDFCLLNSQPTIPIFTFFDLMKWLYFQKYIKKVTLNHTTL